AASTPPVSGSARLCSPVRPRREPQRRPRPGSPAGSERLYRLQHFGDVAGHLDLVPDAAHDPALLPEEGPAVHPPLFAAVPAFLDPLGVAFDDLAVAVGAEGEGQLVLGLELVMRGDRILGDADHRRAGLAVIG